MNVRNRIARLEIHFGSDLTSFGKMIFDELKVMCLVRRDVIIDDPEATDAMRQRYAGAAEKIESEIRHMASKQASPEYERHLQYCRAAWRRRTGRDDYVPALTGPDGNCGFGEYFDWDKPRVMERRAALREHPCVQAILQSPTGGEAANE